MLVGYCQFEGNGKEGSQGELQEVAFELGLERARV